MNNGALTMSGTHSILSPSAAKRWSNCPGSLAATRDIPNPSTKAAALGTCKHTMSEWCFKYNKVATEAARALGNFKMATDGFEFEVDDEFISHVQFYLDAVNAIPGLKEHEIKLDTSAVLGVDGQGGTADTIVVDHDAKMLTVVDAKFGWGRVSAFKNKQLLIYLCAARRRYGDLFDFEKFRVVIVQPPLSVIDGLEHIYMAEDLDAFEAEIRQKAVLAYELYELNDPGMTAANLSPSDEGCEWCPIAGGCIARQNKVAAQFADLTAIATPTPVTMTDDQLGAALIWLEDTVQPLMEAIRMEGYQRALKGQNPAGWGLYAGRDGSRQFLESESANIANALTLTLGDDMYAPRKLKTPTQIEAALKAAKAHEVYGTLEKYITRPPGKPSLQRVRTDKPPLTMAAMPEFGDATDG